MVEVPDERLNKLTELIKPKKTVPTTFEFTDIAGIVKGASRGEGLGNKFLANIREMDAVAYVLRCFDDDDITHVDGRVDPVSDSETVETELMMSDLESIDRRLPVVEKKARSGDKESQDLLPVMKGAFDLLGSGKPARLLKLKENKQYVFRNLQLLT